MKKIICILISAVLLYSIALADGNTNVDGGGSGGMGSGTGGSGGSFWNPGNDGVRITVVDSKSGWLVNSIDMSNNPVNSATTLHFGKTSKLFYSRISQTVKKEVGNYTSFIPATQLPIIISSSSGGKSDINQIRNYFRSEGALKMISGYIGMDYTEMISGKYKLLIEPIAYFKFNGINYAMTATEAACYDKMIGGQLRAKMVSLTHKNLPLSMFLQTADLGFPAWGGGTNTKQDNDRIILALGVGIIYFDEAPPPPTETVTGDLEYPIDTDVITSVYIDAPDQDYTPANGASVSFSAPNGQNITKQFVCPKGERQMMWFKWHTPSTPQTVQLYLGGIVSGTLTANIVDRVENEPPDPKFADKNDSFTLQSTPPTAKSNLSTSWYQWVAVWHAKPRPGYWALYRRDYSATLNVDYQLLPAERVKTAVSLGFNNWSLKSGYGLDAQVKVHVSGEGGVTSSDITPVQHIEAIFPEFGYKNYNRFLQPDNTATYNTTWHFKPNRYSYYHDPVHFVPLWYPDETDFPVPITVADAWTPGGQLHASVSDKVVINGSVYDDWYIRLLR